MAVVAQKLGDRARLFAGVAEDDGALGPLNLDDAQQIAHPAHARHHVIGVDDLGCRDAFVRELDVERRAQIAVLQPQHFVGHRRRKQQRLPIRRAATQDLGDVFQKAHRQHLVRFIEDESLDPRQVERATPQVIEHSTGRSRDKVRARLQRFDLTAHRRTTINGGNRQLATGGNAANFPGDLQRQLTRRPEHEHLRIAVFHIAVGLKHRLHKRDTERRGLARTRTRLNDEIASGNDRTKDPLLNRHGLRKAHVAQRASNIVVQAHFGEGTRRLAVVGFCQLELGRLGGCGRGRDSRSSRGRRGHDGRRRRMLSGRGYRGNRNIN